jgi:hypothetical protein
VQTDGVVVVNEASGESTAGWVIPILAGPGTLATTLGFTAELPLRRSHAPNVFDYLKE